MSLYKLNESSDSLFKSMDFILENTDDIEDQLKEETERGLLEVEDRIKHYETELRNTINSKPRSWLERKLVEFKVKLRKFELKHKLTKSNQSKSILQKILSILTRIVKFINDKLIKFTRYVTDKFDKRSDSRKKFDRLSRLSKIKTAKYDIEDGRKFTKSYKESINDHKDEMERLKAKYKSE